MQNENTYYHSKDFQVGKTLSKIAFVFSVIGFVGCLAGLCGMGLGGGTLIKIGGVTLHGWILNWV